MSFKVDVLVGMQFGSEAKGAVVSRLLTENRKYTMSARVQSIQAGHTVFHKGTGYKMRTIPCAWTDPNVYLVLGAGCFIDRELLIREVDMIDEVMGGSVRDRLFIDRRVYEVEQKDVIAERERNIEKGIGSTAHGCGSSLIRKLWREESNHKLMDWLIDERFQICDTVELMRGHTVLLEGCQGTMLSIHTSPYYPYVSTREATASGVLAEAGIPPFAVRNVIGVFRTLPIRVGGNSGETGGEQLEWSEVSARAGYDVCPERTTVTNRQRRIFEWSFADFYHAMKVNAPNELYMTFANYLAPCLHAKSFEEMPDESNHKVRNFLRQVESTPYYVPFKVRAFNTGERNDDWIDWS